VARLIDGLLGKGFAHNEIVVLTMRGLRNSVFSEQERVGNFTLRRFNPTVAVAYAETPVCVPRTGRQSPQRKSWSLGVLRAA
jgi:hypothetical protein